MLAPVSPPSDFVNRETKGWRAQLLLDFSRRGDVTDLRYRHQGPLRIQKPLYPDGQQCCHAVVVHPPGGIAGSDQLHMTVSVDPQAHAVIMTPSATKWYGSFDKTLARQEIDVNVQGCLEWLPSETIIFDNAHVESMISIHAATEAQLFGWDMLIFGRHGAGERFTSGVFDQTLKLSLGKELVWVDRLRLFGSDLLFESAIGLGGQHAMATCWVVSPEQQAWSDESLELIRLNAPGIAWTRLHSRLLVGRQVGCPIQMQCTLKQAWRVIKQTHWGLPAQDLRLWST